VIQINLGPGSHSDFIFHPEAPSHLPVALDQGTLTLSFYAVPVCDCSKVTINLSYVLFLSLLCALCKTHKYFHLKAIWGDQKKRKFI